MEAETLSLLCDTPLSLPAPGPHWISASKGNWYQVLRQQHLRNLVDCGIFIIHYKRQRHGEEAEDQWAALGTMCVAACLPSPSLPRERRACAQRGRAGQEALGELML